MEKTIYDLELNEVIKHTDENTGGRTYIRRVPGGWIYTYMNSKGMTSCFVPYHAEFKESDEPQGLENI